MFITDVSIKAFELELNNFSKVFEISDYDNAEIRCGGLIKKRDSQGMYLVMLGGENMLVYDI